MKDKVLSDIVKFFERAGMIQAAASNQFQLWASFSVLEGVGRENDSGKRSF